MRCKACDSVLKQTEIVWNTSINTFEDLCRACRNSVKETLQEFDSVEENIRLPQDALTYYEDTVDVELDIEPEEVYNDEHAGTTFGPDETW